MQGSSTARGLSTGGSCSTAPSSGPVLTDACCPADGPAQLRATQQAQQHGLRSRQPGAAGGSGGRRRRGGADAAAQHAVGISVAPHPLAGPGSARGSGQQPRGGPQRRRRPEELPLVALHHVGRRRRPAGRRGALPAFAACTRGRDFGKTALTSCVNRHVQSDRSCMCTWACAGNGPRVGLRFGRLAAHAGDIQAGQPPGRCRGIQGRQCAGLCSAAGRALAEPGDGCRR